MAGTTKTASVTWQGGLMDGKGTITNVGSGTLNNFPVDWKARSESNTATSPEEMLAAANAACFGMALSAGLGQAGHPAEKLDVTANCTFSLDNGPKVSDMVLHVVGTVPGISAEDFEAAAQAAGAGCPVSQAMQGNVNYKVTAELA